MSDHPHSLDERGLPRWVGALLRRPVRLEPGARARLMARVHRAPPPRRSFGAAAWPPSTSARRGFTSLAGVLVAAACMMLVALGSTRTPFAGDDGAPSNVAALLHDSLQVSGVWASHDTLPAAFLRDSLRLVRLVVVAPGMVRLALAGDFSDWRPRLMTSVADSAGLWAAQVLLRPGTHRYTILAGDSAAVLDRARVDDTRAAVWTVTVPVERN